jgi:hypothetical protein
MAETTPQEQLEGKDGKEVVSRALGELKLDMVHTIFRLTKLTDCNEQPGDQWHLIPLQASCPPCQEFDDFYDFLSEFLILPSSVLPNSIPPISKALLLIHGTSETPSLH